MGRLEVRGLSRSYPDEIVALADASFAVADGRIAALLGPSGCGKTTALRLIAGLDRPDAGDVRIDDQSVLRMPAHRRGVGMMFQELALFPHLDVRGNVAFGLRMKRWPRRDRDRRVAELLELVGLADKVRRRMHELSGGERQRVALARALAPQPAVLLLDEPLGALDEQRKQSLRVELRDLLRRLETTVVVVSHDLRDAIVLADDLVVMEAGRVLQSGPLARVLAEPGSPRVAAMVGYVLLARGPVRDGAIVEPDVGRVAVPEGRAGDPAASVFAHPETLLGVPTGLRLGCGVTGVVMRSRPSGPMHMLDVAIGRRPVEVRWEWDLQPPAPASTVEIAARPGTLRFFGEAADAAEDAGGAEALLHEPPVAGKPAQRRALPAEATGRAQVLAVRAMVPPGTHRAPPPAMPDESQDPGRSPARHGAMPPID
ncbi:MAG: ABC transporter ATP-binding protein [Chloroflexi bacterium]|nr:ABC transporter ATP-binding protein [Chloroflexota bacterium]